MLVARQTHSPYNRGAALGQGKVFVGTVDGRLIALDMKTGKVAWDTKLQDSQKLTVGFTGAPLSPRATSSSAARAANGPAAARSMGWTPATGKVKWTFLTVAGTEEAKKTWGNDSWRTGGGGGWMPGTYDTETNTVYWGTANPAPLYDWSGADWKTTGARPGDNLYTTSVLGARSRYRQAEILSSGTAARRLGLRQRGRRVRDARPGWPEIRRASQQGRSRLRLRPRTSRSRTSSRSSQNINFVKSIDPKTGELIGRRDFAPASRPSRCARRSPAASAGTPGSYSPQTGLYYKIGNEWCIDLEVVKTTPVTEPRRAAQHRRELQRCAIRRGRQGLWPVSTHATRSPGRRSGR